MSETNVITVQQVENIPDEGELSIELTGNYQAQIGYSTSGRYYNHNYFLILQNPQMRGVYYRYSNLAYCDTPQGVVTIVSDWNTDLIEKQKAKAERNAKRNADRKTNTSKAMEQVKVGDLFYTNWGYDQTNVEFFQIVEVGKRSIKVRQVGCERLQHSSLTPIKDKFIEDEGIHTRIPKLSSGGRVYFNSPIYGYAYAWDGKPKYYSYN